MQVGSDAFDRYWAGPMSLDLVEKMLDNSTTLGLYKVNPVEAAPRRAESPSSPRTPSPTVDASDNLRQVGMARLVGVRPISTPP